MIGATYVTVFSYSALSTIWQHFGMAHATSADQHTAGVEEMGVENLPWQQKVHMPAESKGNLA